MAAFRLEGVWRKYPRTGDVLRGVDLEVDPGEVVGLLGRNGVGKTTLIHLVGGFLRADRGSVRVLGLDPGASPVELKRLLGFVSENQILPPHFTVQELADLHDFLFRTWDGNLAGRLVSRFGIDARARVGSLSKGQARMLALVCATARRPKLLLLDEPTGGLDPLSRREVLSVAVELLSETEATLLFSSHHLVDLERIASRISLLERGQIAFDATLDEIYEEYCVAVVPADAESSLNRLPTVLRTEKRGSHLHVLLNQPTGAAREHLRDLTSYEAISVEPPTLEEFFIRLTREAPNR